MYSCTHSCATFTAASQTHTDMNSTLVLHRLYTHLYSSDVPFVFHPLSKVSGAGPLPLGAAFLVTCTTWMHCGFAQDCIKIPPQILVRPQDWTVVVSCAWWVRHQHTAQSTLSMQPDTWQVALAYHKGRGMLTLAIQQVPTGWSFPGCTAHGVLGWNFEIRSA